MRVWSRRPRHRARAGEQAPIDRAWSIPDSADQPSGNWRLVVSWRVDDGTPRFRYLSQTMSGVPQLLLSGHHVPAGLTVEPAGSLPDRDWQLGALWQHRDRQGAAQWRITHIGGRYDGDPRYFVYGYRQPGENVLPKEADQWARAARQRFAQSAMRADAHRAAQVPRGRWDAARRERGRHRRERPTVRQLLQRSWAQVKERVRRGERNEPKPVQRLFGYEISKYLLLDAVSIGRTAVLAAAWLHGYQNGGVGLAVAEVAGVWAATATTRGALSATVTKVRERGDRRWEDHQEGKHDRALRADRTHDRQIRRLTGEFGKLKGEVAQLRTELAGRDGPPPRFAPADPARQPSGLRADGWPVEGRTDAGPAYQARRASGRTSAGARASRRAANASKRAARDNGRPGAGRTEPPPRERF